MKRTFVLSSTSIVMDTSSLEELGVSVAVDGEAVPSLMDGVALPDKIFQV